MPEARGHESAPDGRWRFGQRQTVTLPTPNGPAQPDTGPGQPIAVPPRAQRHESRSARSVRVIMATLTASPAQFWTQLLATVVVLSFTASTLLVARPPSGYNWF